MTKHNNMTSASTDPLTLAETWSPEKIEAWRVINVTVKKGDPDGPTENVVTSVRHPVGVELHAECNPYVDKPRVPERLTCNDIPGERCNSGFGDGCGFYAFKTHAQAVEQARLPISLSSCSSHIQYAPCPKSVARVLLSGKVIEHEEGYRAEILEVIEVEAPSDTDVVFAPPGPTSDVLTASWPSSYTALSSRQSTTFSDIYKGGQ